MSGRVGRRPSRLAARGLRAGRQPRERVEQAANHKAGDMLGQRVQVRAGRRLRRDLAGLRAQP